MKQTAMQEHIDWLKSTLEICEEHATPLINCLKLCISNAKSKLEMEKEQIEKAFNDGFEEMPYINGQSYYKETFKSE